MTASRAIEGTTRCPPLKRLYITAYPSPRSSRTITSPPCPTGITLSAVPWATNTRGFPRRPSGSDPPPDKAITARRRLPFESPSQSAIPAPDENPPTPTLRGSTLQRANARWSVRSTKSTSTAPRVHAEPAAAGDTITSPGTLHALRKAQRPPGALPLPAPCSATSSALAPPPRGVTRMRARRSGEIRSSYSPGGHGFASGLGRASKRKDPSATSTGGASSR